MRAKELHGAISEEIIVHRKIYVALHNNLPYIGSVMASISHTIRRPAFFDQLPDGDMIMADTKNPATEMLAKAQADIANMSESFRQMAEKGVAQSSEAYAQFKTLAEDATSAAQQSFDAMREGMTVLSTKAMENAKINAETGVAFVEKVTKAKTFAEVIEMQGEFFRSAFERLSAQAKEAQELTMKVTEKAAAPVKASAEKATAAVSKEAAKATKSPKAA